MGLRCSKALGGEYGRGAALHDNKNQHKRKDSGDYTGIYSSIKDWGWGRKNARGPECGKRGVRVRVTKGNEGKGGMEGKVRVELVGAQGGLKLRSE